MRGAVSADARDGRGWAAAAIIMAAVLGTAACASSQEKPTGYTRAESEEGSARYGYRDKRISEDEFSVAVQGNRVTSKEKVARIALRRAAELAKEHGNSHFVVVKQRTEIAAGERLQSVLLFTGGMPLWVPVGESRIHEPVAVLIVRLLRPQASYPPEAREAEEVLRSLIGDAE